MKVRGFSIFFCCLLFGLVQVTALCQDWTLFSEADGLVGDSVWSLHEDRKGYLWFVTEFSGVSRYDGIRFENFRSMNTQDSLASDNIYFTMADSAGNFWFGTDRGVSKFDGFYFSNFDQTHGLAGNYITFIHEDEEGLIWLGTHNGVSRFDGKTFQNFDTEDGLSDNNIKYILFEPASEKKEHKQGLSPDLIKKIYSVFLNVEQIKKLKLQIFKIQKEKK